MHEMVSLSPNNRPSTVGVSTSLEPESPPQPPSVKKKLEDGFDILGPALRKGPRKPPKHDKGREPPVWVIKKPQNTFEPQFKKVVPLHLPEKEKRVDNKNGDQ